MATEAAPPPWPHAATYLACPVCGAVPAATGRSLRCPAGHSFDLARQGYVNLLTGAARAPAADTAAMVDARARFLTAGHYAPLARAIASLTARACRRGPVVDAGCGTGYYTAAVLDEIPAATGIGLDSSPYALRRAAKAHPRLAAVCWDVWRRLPLRDACAEAVVNVFAPRNGPEFARVLRPGGALIVVTPTTGHLTELREHRGMLTVDADKDTRLRTTLGDHFNLDHTTGLDLDLHLTPAHADALVAMGPSAHHDTTRGRNTPVRTRASFRIALYRPRH